ncbi:MAG: hypothetical protein ACREAM_07365 [Blastocatellia bacterium]
MRTRVKTRTKTRATKATTITPAEARKFAELRHSGTPEGMEAYQRYCRLLSRAVREGRIGEPRHIEVLYPLAVEIRAELGEIEIAERDERRATKKRVLRPKTRRPDARRVQPTA